MATRRHIGHDFAPVAGWGLMVSVFSDDDIPQLAKAAAADLVRGLDPDEAAAKLNRAIHNAALAAEGARIHLPPAALKQGCKRIASTGRAVLRSLGLPSDPGAYTWDPGASVTDMFGQSAIVNALRRSVDRNIEALPIPGIPDGAEHPTWERTRDPRESLRAIKGPPTQSNMVPSGIARATLPSQIYEHLIQPHVNLWMCETDDGPRKMEAQAEVECLLRMAPGAVALLVSLAENLEQVKDTIRPNKANFRRIFRQAVFFHFTVAYQKLFGSFPRSSDNERDPENGLGTLWFNLALRLAASRPNGISVIPKKSPAKADLMHRDSVIRELQELSGLELTTKAKKLGESVRAVRALPSYYDQQSEEDLFGTLDWDSAELE
jgi:hypothetical protein